jgi:hypothetical protein
VIAKPNLHREILLLHGFVLWISPTTLQVPSGSFFQTVTWLTTIVTNAARMQLRRRRGYFSLDEQQVEDGLIFSERLPGFEAKSRRSLFRVGST